MKSICAVALLLTQVDASCVKNNLTMFMQSQKIAMKANAQGNYKGINCSVYCCPCVDCCACPCGASDPAEAKKQAEEAKKEAKEAVKKQEDEEKKEEADEKKEEAKEKAEDAKEKIEDKKAAVEGQK